MTNPEFRPATKKAAVYVGPTTEQTKRAQHAHTPMLPVSLLNLIGEYGFAARNRFSEVERIYRWEQLIAGIKAFVASQCAELASELVAELRAAQEVASSANAQLSTLVFDNDTEFAIRDAKCASVELIQLQHRARAAIAKATGAPS